MRESNWVEVGGEENSSYVEVKGALKRLHTVCEKLLHISSYKSRVHISNKQFFLASKKGL